MTMDYYTASGARRSPSHSYESTSATICRRDFLRMDSNREVERDTSEKLIDSCNHIWSTPCLDLICCSVVNPSLGFTHLQAFAKVAADRVPVWSGRPLLRSTRTTFFCKKDGRRNRTLNSPFDSTPQSIALTPWPS